MNILVNNNLDLLTVGISVTVVGILGFLVYFNNKKSITNRTFLYFAIAAICWGIVNYLNYKFNSAVIVLWLLRLVIFFAVWYCFFLFRFFYVFPYEQFTFPRVYKYFIVPVVILTSILTLTPFIFPKINNLAPVGQVSQINPEKGIIIFGIVVFFLIFSSFFVLLRKVYNATKVDQPKFIFLLIGAIITFVLHLIFNFIFPAFLNNQQFIPLGAVFIFPFAAFTSYAVIRHRLFNVRVLGTATLVVALSIVSFIEVALADNFALIVYRVCVLFAILVFGILLIRGVLKEVRQREEIAQMAEDVRRAYAVEKQAKEELEKLDKIKDQFLMITQHNLRTPLTSMMGYSDLLLQGIFGKQNKKTVEVLQKFQVLTQSMIKMVNDFLDMAQFQLGKGVLTLKSGVDLTLMMTEINTELEFKAKGKNVYLKFEKPEQPVFIRADREKLKASLFNIVDNAVKYTPQGGVTVKLESNGMAKVTVSDTGIGIPPDKVGKIFDTMFERTEEAKKTAMGTGVGLYLSGQIIRSHNGKVWAESGGIGKGSAFYVELPVDQHPDPKAQEIKVQMQSSPDSQSKPGGQSAAPAVPQMPVPLPPPPPLNAPEPAPAQKQP